MAGPDVQRDGENESRLRKERLASSRAPDDIVGPSTWQPPPPVANPSPAGGDRAMSGVARQQQMENRLNLQRQQEEKPEKEKKGGGGAPSPRDAAMLAKATPAGAVAGAAAGVATGKISKEDVQRGIGRGCILMLWGSLWSSFGHAIYLIGILFYIASTSKYARQYFPEVGEEWFPAEMIKKMPKSTLIPIKMAEIVGIAFILFWTLMLDLGCVGIVAFLLGLLTSASNIVS